MSLSSLLNHDCLKCYSCCTIDACDVDYGAVKFVPD